MTVMDIKNGVTYKKPRALCRRLEKNLSDLRPAYKKALASNEIGLFEWLRDNYYLIEREGRSALRSVKYCPALPFYGSSLPHIFGICLRAAQSGDDDLEQALRYEIETSEHTVSTRELQSLPFMLKAALVDVACSSVKVSDGQSVSLLGSAVTGIRSLPSIDFEQIIEDFSEIEKIFDGDPAGVYSHMDENTRAIYRSRCIEIAHREKIDETAQAHIILKKARAASESRKQHIGCYLLEEPAYNSRKVRGNIFLSLRFIVPLIISAMLAIFSSLYWLIPVLYFPMFEICRPILEFFAIKGVKPTYLPRLDLKGEIPESAPTLVTISTLIPQPDKADRLYKRLEHLYQTNCRGEIRFCVLCDLKECSLPTKPEDTVAIEALTRVIKKLNKKYDSKFILIIRPRVKVKTQQAFAGYERKRGAITELVRYIHTGNANFRLIEGDKAFLRRVKYLLALDSDTELLMDTASQMVAAALHPLNTPQIDTGSGVVTKGYGIIAPSIAPNLKSASKTPFSSIMSGAGGITAYDTLSGDIYQDLFGQSIFSGKGLIDTVAYYKCLDTAFPDQRVLSHDILEGSYLRTAYMSDVEMTDECPSNMRSYLMRQHRWIRGDWQNILWLFGRVPSQIGDVKNPINGLSKYMLLDNLRRSVTAPFALLCLILTFFLPENAMLLSVTALLSAVAPGLFSCIYSLICGGIQMISRKYYSRVMPIAIESLANALLDAVTLVQSAIISISAICLALYRQLVSRKNLLQWTTAADSESSSGFVSTFISSLPSVIFGCLLLFVGESFTHLMAYLFISSPFVMYFTSVKWKRETVQITSDERDLLKAWAASMWRFYDELAGKQDNYLPPDNIQEAPVHAVAHRTSPTNIGLMLLCILAARDFGFIDTDTMCQKIELTLSSVEKLEKWEGNLLNWYNTKTLKPLHPRFVSTVDSGNFACCLAALSAGLAEYADASDDIKPLISRIDKIIKETDLSPFYNSRRKLFHIGYDIELGALSPSYYDLLMSESRMTSYFAIATRQVPKKHWGALGRTLAKEGGYTGPVSWTGTMFEYFMPQLLLPVYENSLGFEALRFCIHCQRSRAKSKGAPWGCSESAFYAFDPQYNYQYKAHGVQRLGLKRGLNQEFVVSPYSSFLTLPTVPHSSMRNLQRLEDMDMTGRYGFYESADFTPSRAGSAGYSIIRSYMAHHIGMSFIAVCNTLYGNIMQKRFMLSHGMAAAEELLQEKIPAGAAVFDDIIEPEVPDKLGRTSSATETIENINIAEPRMHLLTNGQYTLAITDSGCGVSFSQGADIYRRSSDLLRSPSGLFAIVETEKGSFSITKAPDYHSAAEHSAEFAQNYAAFYASAYDIDAGMMTCVHPSIQCEQRKFIIKNKGTDTRSLSLLLYFEPSLAKPEDDSAHPAFSRLFIRSEYLQDLNIICLTRRSRGGEPALHVAAGFAEGIPFEYSFNREKIIERPYGVSSLTKEPRPLLDGSAGVPDPCVAARVNAEIQPRSQKQLTFVVTCASTREEAISRLIMCRSQGALSSQKAALSPLFDGGLESRICASVLPSLFYPVKDTRKRIEYALRNDQGTSALWAAGISGDLPIVVVELKSLADINKWEPYIKMHRRLRLCGIKFDLCIFYREGGEYTQPITNSLKDMIRLCGSEELAGRSGGIHCIDKLKQLEETVIAIITASCYIAPQNLVSRDSHPSKYSVINIQPASTTSRPLPKGIEVNGGIFHDIDGHGAFTISSRPQVPWCQVLANENFGTLVSDMSLGYTWAKNSRENKLTPWFNDTRTDNRGEMLIARINGKYYDLLWGARATFTRSSAQYLGKIDGVEYTVKVTLPSCGMTKYIEIEYENPQGIETAYYTEPVLGVSRSAAKSIKASFKEGVLSLCNPAGSAAPGYMCISANAEDSSFVCDRKAFLSGNWNTGVLAPLSDPCGAVIVGGGKKRITFTLSFSETSAYRPDMNVPAANESTPSSIKISTDNKLLDELINTWLPSQIEQSRLWGRTAFYQCGGAYGFRDQLQDTCAQMIWNPAAARAHIIRCCEHQFEEGDVLHWWHPLATGDSGVRTRGSDDMLFLPFTVYEYVERTADTGILHEQVRYITAPPLDEGEHERYIVPALSENTGSVYEHCMRAISTIKLGSHGLPLIGAFDWNDGFSKIGINGQGESVWLAQFAAIVCERMAALAMYAGHNDDARELLEKAAVLKENVDKSAWSGDWYLRAFYDDGRPVGAPGNAECEIDILPQAFSALSGMPDKDRRERAINSALSKCVDKNLKIVKLFTPPFDHDDPGYIRGYPPGVRENGGQYTHAAVWLSIALFKEGRADEAYSLLRLMSPAEKYLDKEISKIYKTEPYAITADVYSCSDAPGRGGWSLYTGAASWYYRAVVCHMLGINIRGSRVQIHPCLPIDFGGYSAEISMMGSKIRLKVEKGQQYRVIVDGTEGGDIILDGSDHDVTVITNE